MTVSADSYCVFVQLCYSLVTSKPSTDDVPENRTMRILSTVVHSVVVNYPLLPLQLLWLT